MRLIGFTLFIYGTFALSWAGILNYLSPQWGVNVGKYEQIHLRGGVTLKCCSRSGQIYGNITGLGVQLELTPYRYSLQAGFPLQVRYRKNGYWGVRPYYFYGHRYTGKVSVGTGIQASTPYGGLGIEFESDRSQLLFGWDF